MNASNALTNLLDEVRAEAEKAVRTDYENTVILLREDVAQLRLELEQMTKSNAQWRDSYHRTDKELAELQEKLYVLSGH